MRRSFGLTVLVAGTLVGCGEEPITGFVADVHRIEVAPDSVVLSSIGQMVLLEARALDISGDPVPRVQFEWISTSESVVSVDEEGRISPLSRGESTIIARVGSIEGRAAITVTVQDKVDP